MLAGRQQEIHAERDRTLEAPDSNDCSPPASRVMSEEAQLPRCPMAGSGPMCVRVACLRTEPRQVSHYNADDSLKHLPNPCARITGDMSWASSPLITLIRASQ